MFRFKGLLAIFQLLLVSTNCFAQEKPQINRLAGFYSITNSKGISLTINPERRSYTLKRDAGTLQFYEEKQRHTYSFATLREGKRYTLWLYENKRTKEKSFDLQVDHRSQLFSKECDSTATHLRIEKQIQDIQKIFESSPQKTVNLDNVIDSSCKDFLGVKSLNQLRKRLVHELDPTSSNLGRCLTKTATLERFKKYPQFLPDLEKIVSGYLAEINQPDDKFPRFKFACEVNEKEKYKAKYSPGKMTFRIDETKDLTVDAIKNNQCPQFSVTFGHEFAHHLGVSDEKAVEFLSQTCAQVNNTEDYNSSACSVTSCADSDSCKNKILTILTNQSAAEVQQAKQEHAQATAQLTQAAPQVELRQPEVSSQGWSEIGRATESSEIPSAARTISQVAASNFNSMAKTLDRALGAIETPSIAATGGGRETGNSSTKSGRSPASESKIKASKAGKESYKTVEEYLVKQNQIISKNLDSKNPEQIKAADSSVKTNIASALNSSELAGAANSGPGSPSSGLNVRLRPANTAGSQRAPASASSGAPSVLNETLRKLEQESELRGSDYDLIRSQYTRKEFKKILLDKKIGIKTPVANLGAKQDKAIVRFIDDGESLKRVED